MEQEDIKQTLKDKLKDCDKEVLIDIIAEMCSIYVNARILSNINSINSIQHCVNNIQTNIQEVENSITQKVKEIMTVEELIEKLKTLPKDYYVVFESGDAYGSAYCAYADDIEVNHKTKTVEIKEI